MTATNDAAFATNTHPVPIALINTPATAGPTMRALLKIALFRLTAFGTSSGPTNSVTKACRVGVSRTAARPRANASR